MKLDIGSGPWPFKPDEFIHLDFFPEYPHLEILANCFELPFKDQCFDYVRASHVVEHVPLEKGIEMMKEMGRVLMEGGGILEVVIPDFGAFMERWNSLEPKDRLDWNTQRVIMGDKALGRGMEHYAIYDVSTIEYLMKKNGVRINRVDRIARGPRDVIIYGEK